MIRRAQSALRRVLVTCRKGATLVEFGFVAPVLILTVMGIFDVGYKMYTTSILQGAIQKAARDSTLEDGTSKGTAIDNRVKAIFQDVSPSATYEFERQSYTNFSDVGMPEDFTDQNNDGECSTGEPYEDANGNGSWDADQGAAGNGGARDAVLYTVRASYDRLFPMAGLIGLPETETIEASTVLRNQPYGEQEDQVEILECE